MKITNVETFCLRADLNRAIGFSQWYYTSKNNLLVKITTDDGQIGWGECYGPNQAIAVSIEKHFKPLLVGRNPLEHEHLWYFLWKAFCDFNRKGIFMAAISGLDMALWDLKGKAYGRPVYELLGGSGEPIPCYATGMYFRDDRDEEAMLAELLDEGAGYVNDGFRFLKVKIGKNPEFDLKLISAFRERFPDVLLAADSNHAYNFKEAVRIGRELEKQNYVWFEEPLCPEEAEGMAELRQRLDIPIAAGECEQTRFGFMNLAKHRSLDIFQPDLAYCGGITEFQKIAAIASASRIEVVPHCWGLRVNQAAAASAISMLPETPGRFERRPVWLEADLTEHPVRDSIFKTTHTIKNGTFYFNDLPGLGVEVNEPILQEFIIEPDDRAVAFSKAGA